METIIDSGNTDRELALLNQIEADPEVNQATLADSLGVAVGTINWHLKRMIAKGYVKASRMQRKKLRYILTPEGIALRAKLTVDYIKNSFSLYKLVRQRTQKIIEEASSLGVKQVRIVGDGEVAEVCRLSCIEAGLTVTEAPAEAAIVIDGLKLALKSAEEVRETSVELKKEENHG